MQITANAIQVVEPNQNILFTETPVCGNRCMSHREGSGLVSLRGLTNQCYARYRVTFSGNIAVPTGGTAEEISVAIAIDGEAVQSTRMRVTPAAADNYFNVSAPVDIPVQRGCCVQASVENLSTQNINVQNANMIIERKS